MQYYVNASASASGRGTKESPFKTIGQAAAAARPGDEVVVAPGIYREQVEPAFGGTEDARIVYRAEKPGTAVITGAEIIDEWERVEGNIWKTVIPNGYFNGFNPYTTELFGDWFRDLGRVNHLGQVYYDGCAYVEEDSLEKLKAGEPLYWAWDKDWSAAHKWYTCQEEGGTAIYALFPDGDPGNGHVEINVRRRVFFPAVTGINYVTVSGFVLKQAATQWAPPTAFQEGLIGPHWSKGWIIEDCEVSNSRCSGISLGKCLHPSDNRWTKERVKSGTQLERDIILYAQHTGWSKETVGSHIVRRCRIHHCGQTGIVGHLGGVFCLIEDNDIHDINTLGEFSGSELGGIKLHAAIDTIIRRNHIHHNHRGIWLDWQTQGTRVSGNLFHDNTGEEDTRTSEDLYIEVSHGPALVDNNLFLSPFALRERSQGLCFVHNIIAGPIDTGSSEGRFTPYHFPHETDVMGFMTFLNGDDRFYNNIFIQPDLPEEKKIVRNPKVAKMVGMNTEVNIECGLHVYDDYPLPEEYFYQFTDEGTPLTSWGRRFDYNCHLPMYVSGNAYFNGAKPYAKETGNYVDTEHRVWFEVKEENGHWIFRSNLYEYLPHLATEFISTEMLGKAFEPEQAYESPDGSPIRIAEDYCGVRRAAHPAIGPFEKGTGEWIVW